uniref:Uncharacterized protein n=1 Tax=Aegilops tauschii subsp. strangulata TaxID=200361 RepID=A0A453A2A0_AEGTS
RRPCTGRTHGSCRSSRRPIGRPSGQAVLRMRSSKTNGSVQKAGRVSHAQGEGPSWVLVAGGVLVSTLSVRLGCKLKQMFDTKKQNSTSRGLMLPFAVLVLIAVICAVC